MRASGPAADGRRDVLALMLCALVAGVAALSSAASAAPLLRDPSASRTRIAFGYAGHIWIADRDGRNVRQLTRGGREEKPIFSPDGARIAFTGTYDGAHGVYVVPAAGGSPHRLTYHPADIEATSWTPDGKRVLFTSRRGAFAPGVVQLFSVPAAGGFAAQVPLVRASEGSLSPDGSQIAYVPEAALGGPWKDYRGGRARRIVITNLADSSIRAEIPRGNSNDFDPMWVGDKVYFLSDREGPVSLYAYDLRSKAVRSMLKGGGLDVKSASASGGVIAYEQFGSLHIFDPKTESDLRLGIRPTADLAEVRPHARKIEPQLIRSATLSPSGAEALVAARGEIFVLPAKGGEARDVTQTADVVERDPAWSPDGNSIAYFSDESGHYALHIRDLRGAGAVRKIELGSPPAFYYRPLWSPDSRKIAYTDNHLNYWFVDLKNRERVRVDTDTYVEPARRPHLAWSPDGRWLVYDKQLPSHLHAVFAFSLDRVRSYQLTLGVSDARDAVFDPTGKYLYFTASTDTGLAASSMEMSSYQRPVTRNVYVAMLQAGEAPPPGRKAGGPGPVPAIEVEGVADRISALPIPAGNYQALFAAAPGVLLLLEAPSVDTLDFPPGDSRRTVKLEKFDLGSRAIEQLLDGVGLNSVSVSTDGGTILFSRSNSPGGPGWFVAPTEGSTHTPPTALDLGSMEVAVEPRAEWRHMYQQVWRDEQEFFYDPRLHGLDLRAIEKTYEPFLDDLSTRDDLNYLFAEMLGNLHVGHMFVGGGDLPRFKPANTGLLGADYTVERGRYRFARIFRGDSWNPKARAPLAPPGVDVKAGDYLLAVNGREVRPPADVYSFFEGTAGKPVRLTVGSRPDGVGSRTVEVVPVGDELPLRNFAWAEANRHRVDEESDGRVGYVYLPNTGPGGYLAFNRYYFGQVGKPALIVDARYNGGGDIPDYFIEYLSRPLTNYFHTPAGQDLTTPQEAIFGPKAMIINEFVGSGGDALAWMFHRAGLGPLIGKRTGGYLVGSYTSPDDLLDGGFVNTPNLAFYSPDGAWDIENHGVSPDIEVEDDPAMARAGRDPQLEKAVAVVMDRIRKEPLPAPGHPPFPNYHDHGR